MKPLKILIACECSGRSRDAFLALGHEAISCDLKPTEVPGPHYEGPVEDILDFPWDMMIAHPPCYDIAAASGATMAAKERDGRMHKAASFFMKLVKADIPRICIENPISKMSTLWRQPDQTIHPWMFGDDMQKSTCLWLKNLPRLVPTHSRVSKKTMHNMPPSMDRSTEKSRTFEGIAQAFSKQWGLLPPHVVQGWK